ncbi:hypothetical protein SNOG_14119 [Parastagonospora nodorum SN15]|uniref:Uncharacterized protein n=2 Tax=Phaeosphaeria nodorum (strain SN15 / ATCC MYA-4574 / FGSC 10173) TaxID=321614 RepID=A0A7U2FDL7_PHANO|nr:hypothetical protein SNOG_14119 [Parastagonospora nodorum SN15]EAT78356.1 hypothetical protein SNOG_14119 [Parastagonospora nodorum SN15]QRD03118.1 hypothetical protein JI435_141190 [Parastagonospora nodorum SN15]
MTIMPMSDSSCTIPPKSAIASVARKYDLLKHHFASSSWRLLTVAKS